MNHVNIYQQCFDAVGIVAHENAYNIECNLTDDHHNPNLRNHHLGNCMNNTHSNYFNHSSEYEV